MSEDAEKQIAVAEPVAVKKVKKAAAIIKPKKAAVVKKSNHPRTAEMVDAAIGALKERGGSSILAIKKYVASTYKVDVEKLAPFIKRYVKGAVIKGHFVQTKGKGASGSFKMSVQPKKTATAAKPKVVNKKIPAGEPEKKKKKSLAVAKKDNAIKVKVGGIKKSGTANVVEKKTAAKPKSVVKPKKVAPTKQKAAAAPKPKVKKPPTKKVSLKK